jgi:hypothetical protein
MKLSAREIQRFIDQGIFKKAITIKNVRFTAARLVEDIEITTLVEGPGGIIVEETRKSAKAGEWLITQVVNGLENRYAVGAEKFEKLYERDSDGNFTPRRDANGDFPRKVVYIVDRDIEFEPPWGGSFRLFAGGCVVPEAGKFYGINPVELAATHELTLQLESCAN